MRIVLLNPPYKKYFIRSARWTAQAISGSNWYPIWLAYCAGLLEKHGHQVTLLDALAEGISSRETCRRVADFAPGLTVIYPSIDSLASDAKIAADIKSATESIVIFVGPWASAAPEEMLQASPSVDAVAKGEFDYTVLEMAQGRPLAEIKGLLWRKDEKNILNAPRPPVSGEQLQGFPFISDVYRRHLKIRKYFQGAQLFPFIDLFTGRGCDWGKCTFCLWPQSMNKGAPYRVRKLDSVYEELCFISKEMPYIREVFIQDDTLPVWRARELSSMIIESGLRLTWSGYARADLDIDTLRLMKRSGCRGLHVGFESSDDNILRLCAKGTTKKMAEEFCHTAAALGFIIHADFILGLPGEGLETIKKTIAWARSLPAHSYQFVYPRVYPGTPLRRLLDQKTEDMPHMDAGPDLSGKELFTWCKKAVWECHFNLPYVLRMLRSPREFLRALRSGRFVIGSLIFRR